MKRGLRLEELERYAIAERGRSFPEARGLCFQAALTLGQVARGMGLEEQVAFVRWRVRQDVNFLEHWALVLDCGTVLDMTAVQVDGNPYPLRRVDGYPANYVRPRQYPAAIVLSVMERPELEADRHFSRRMLWRLHVRLFRHDAAQALRGRSLRALVDAVDEVLRRGTTLSLGYLLERAIGRMSRILIRMK
jgi:hypothetical protein